MQDLVQFLKNYLDGTVHIYFGKIKDYDHLKQDKLQLYRQLMKKVENSDLNSRISDKLLRKNHSVNLSSLSSISDKLLKNQKLWKVVPLLVYLRIKPQKIFQKYIFLFLYLFLFFFTFCIFIIIIFYRKIILSYYFFSLSYF